MATALAMAAVEEPPCIGDDSSNRSTDTPHTVSDVCPPTPSRRQRRFSSVMLQENVDTGALADMTWSGVPTGMSRCEVWQILLDYRPVARERREPGLEKKRQEYLDLRNTIYDSSVAAVQCNGDKSPGQLGPDGRLLRQIRKDLPRTQARFARDVPGTVLGAAEQVVRSPQIHGLMERVLFIWAVRQPASGYVQGIDGILLLLLLVFLADRGDGIPEHLDLELLETLGEGQLNEVEADCYWCVSKVLSWMYDHYCDGFPGIQRMAVKWMELMRRIDAPLAEHFENEGIDVFETAVRWVGCLMVRELPVASCARLWDALIAESVQAGNSLGFETLLLYFCLCFLARFSLRLREMDFEELTMFLKRGTTEDVSVAEVEVLLGEAFVLKSLFQQAPSHLPKGGEACIGPR